MCVRSGDGFRLRGRHMRTVYIMIEMIYLMTALRTSGCIFTVLDDVDHVFFLNLLKYYCNIAG
jgi:hypothetical protein